MGKKLAGIAIVLTLLGAAGCAYDNPTQPAPPLPNLSAPAQVSVGASPGTGTQAGTATVSATVQNLNGAALPNVVVTFVTSRGTIAPAQVATGTNGVATATLTSSETADVTASVGTLSAHMLVVSNGGSTPPTTPTLPVAFLNVSGSATTGVPVVFSVSSSVSGATWNWSFGDGANDQSTTFAISHAYGRAGTYVATVSSSVTFSSSATVVVTDPTSQPGTPVTGLAASMTCTPATHGTPTPCNVSVTYGGTNLPSANITGVHWDWGDGLPDLTTTPVNTHTYANAGTYVVFASVNAQTANGGQTATTTKSVVIP
jgi:hypothetical protein